MTSDFEPPPKSWNVLSTVGGIATALLAIWGLQTWLNSFHKNASVKKPETETVVASPQPNLEQLDAKSLEMPGKPVPVVQIIGKPIVYQAPGGGELSTEEMETAREAWHYFETNWNLETGMVNSVDGLASVTMWDQAAAMAALVSARELGIIPEAEFQDKMTTMLKTLANLRLYKDELPNKVYNTKTLIPVNYGKVDEREEIGWSALDLGRMAIWLKIVGARYPQLASLSTDVWKHWHTQRLTKDGEMYGTAVADGKEAYNQEGRLGYENYAAYGLKLWGLNVSWALNPRKDVGYVDLFKQGIPYDLRDAKNSGANNYVLSEPYILDGIETGFQSLPRPYADRILAAQEARFEATKLLTALTEDNLDREPYFVYNTLLVNGEPWATIVDTGKNYNNLRFMSAKAAIGWYVLYNDPYTQKLFAFIQDEKNQLKTKKGWYNGSYEATNLPVKSLTANNNAVILESMLYKKVGKPLAVWAGVGASGSSQAQQP